MERSVGSNVQPLAAVRLYTVYMLTQYRPSPIYIEHSSIRIELARYMCISSPYSISSSYWKMKEGDTTLILALFPWLEVYGCGPQLCTVVRSTIAPPSFLLTHLCVGYYQALPPHILTYQLGPFWQRKRVLTKPIFFHYIVVEIGRNVLSYCKPEKQIKTVLCSSSLMRERIKIQCITSLELVYITPSSSLIKAVRQDKRRSSVGTCCISAIAQACMLGTNRSSQMNTY